MTYNSTIRFQELFIELSYLCNAQCNHCYVSAGPHVDATKLDMETIFNVIRQSLDVDEIAPKVAIAGGEPTLFWDDLLAVISYAAKNGLQTLIISNGWWGQSKDACKKKLDELIESGLTRIEISTSAYHREYISPSSVNNIIELCRERPIELSMHIRTNKSCGHRENIALFDVDQVELMSQAIIPTGRAAVKIDGSEFTYSDGLPHGNCRHDLSFLVKPNGDCYPCCGGSELTASLRLGNIKEESLKEIIDRLNRRRLLSILTGKGPSFIANGLIADGFTQIDRDCHVGICDLCTGISQSPGLSMAAERWVNSPDSNIRQLESTPKLKNDFFDEIKTNRQTRQEISEMVIPILRKLAPNEYNLDTNVYRFIQHQPSGAILLPFKDYYLKIVKTSSPYVNRILNQIHWLEHAWNQGVTCIPKVLFKFSEKNGITGYVMPRYRCNTPGSESETISKVTRLLINLETIWRVPVSSPKAVDWNGYVFRVEKILSEYDNTMAELLRNLGIQIGRMKEFKKSYTVHGDPTFENIVYDGDGNLILLDPNPQPDPAVPIPELDFAKVMQSAFGWESFVYGRSTELLWNRDLRPVVSSRFGPSGWPVCTWLLITHLVRTLPYGAKINDPYSLLSTIKLFLYHLRDDLRNLN